MDTPREQLIKEFEATLNTHALAGKIINEILAFGITPDIHKVEAVYASMLQGIRDEARSQAEAHEHDSCDDCGGLRIKSDKGVVHCPKCWGDIEPTED